MDEENVLNIRNLQFCWPSGQRDVLDLEALSVDVGERVFLQGQSGAGKTTLLGLIAGINHSGRGQIEVLGRSMSAMRQRQRDQFRADHIGFIFQLFNLVPYLSVLDNVTLACRFSKSRRQRAEQQSGSLNEEARRLLDHLCLDVSALAHKPAAELSVGQQQRVAAARALIGSPELLIADEPTSALDADAAQVFLDLLMSECEAAGSSVLFVSHDVSLQAHFDRTVQLARINRAAMPVQEGGRL